MKSTVWKYNVKVKVRPKVIVRDHYYLNKKTRTARRWQENILFKYNFASKSHPLKENLFSQKRLLACWTRENNKSSYLQAVSSQVYLFAEFKTNPISGG